MKRGAKPSGQRASCCGLAVEVPLETDATDTVAVTDPRQEPGQCAVLGHLDGGHVVHVEAFGSLHDADDVGFDVCGCFHAQQYLVPLVPLSSANCVIALLISSGLSGT